MPHYEIWTNPYPGEQGALRHVFRRWGESLESVKRAAELMAASGERGVCIVDVPPEGNGRVEIVYEVPEPSQRQLKCLHCGYEWLPRVSAPQRCPHCNSPAWNRPVIRRRPPVQPQDPRPEE